MKKILMCTLLCSFFLGGCDTGLTQASIANGAYDDPEDALIIQVGSPAIRINLEKAPDWDEICVELQAGRTYEFDIQWIYGSGLDLWIGFFSGLGGGDYEFYVDETKSQGDERFTFTPTESKKHYCNISDYSMLHTGTYSIRVTEQ